MRRDDMPAEREAAIRSSLASALQTGAAVLEANGSALDAVEEAVKQLEDDPLFNAGRGAVFNSAGEIELDASIMDGATLRAGAVAGVKRTRHPIELARTVMEKSPHVMMIGAGADQFARDQGLEQVDPNFFFTKRRWQELIHQQRQPDVRECGTVGAVALDRGGNVAAATSTGGVKAKPPGRVGDSAIIGAGTYASNRSCAVSGTGNGELFIRLTLAREVATLVEYKSEGLQAAADEMIHGQLKALNGDGGVIAVAPDGQGVWSFNSQGMYRARLIEGGQAEVAMFQDE